MVVHVVEGRNRGKPAVIDLLWWAIVALGALLYVPYFSYLFIKMTVMGYRHGRRDGG